MNTAVPNHECTVFDCSQMACQQVDVIYCLLVVAVVIQVGVLHVTIFEERERYDTEELRFCNG